MGDVDGSTYAFDSVTDEMCAKTKKWMNESDSKGNPVDHWTALGGMKQMSKAFERGMVLVMSIWDDSDAKMQWLDAKFPVDGTNNGDERGPCQAPSSQYPESTRNMFGPGQFKADAAPYSEQNLKGYQYAAKVAFSNIKFGKTLGFTYQGEDPKPTTAQPTTTHQNTVSPNGVQQLNQRCGTVPFGDCNPDLVCMGDDLKLCVKPDGVELASFPRQFHESCSASQSCSVHGLICQQLEDQYSECVIDPSAPPTTQAPVTRPTTQAPVTSPTTQVPVTTQAPTTKKPEPTPGQNKCIVCNWNCVDINNWITKQDDWSSRSESNCRQTTGGSTCFCLGPNAQACYDKFSQKSGTWCDAGRLLDLIV